MTNELELELGLELSLGNGVKGKSSNSGSGRILTAKDFPNGFSSAGTKRERAASPPSAAASQVVGWPPIRAYRMNTLFNQLKTSNVDQDKGNNENNDTVTMVEERGHHILGFVKVNMDGLPIGRKVDLNAHKTYETLASTLEVMFFEKSKQSSPKLLLDGSSEFVLTYEDKEGDWMLVGDVPWGMFLNTVKRLRIMRTSEANGLAPNSQERNEKQKGKPI